jgi:hypothetical protein
MRLCFSMLRKSSLILEHSCELSPKVILIKPYKPFLHKKPSATGVPRFQEKIK